MMYTIIRNNFFYMLSEKFLLYPENMFLGLMTNPHVEIYCNFSVNVRTMASVRGHNIDFIYYTLPVVLNV